MATARQLEQPGTNLYEQDFLAWVENQAEALRARQVGAIDWANLLEEVESMGISQRHEIKSRLTILLMHLIKWAWQPEKRGNSWRKTIRVQRREIVDLLNHSRSLKPYIQGISAVAWGDAREDAEDETGLPLLTFPMDCPWDMESQILDKDWMPE